MPISTVLVVIEVRLISARLGMEAWCNDRGLVLALGKMYILFSVAFLVRASRNARRMRSLKAEGRWTD